MYCCGRVLSRFLGVQLEVNFLGNISQHFCLILDCVATLSGKICDAVVDFSGPGSSKLLLDLEMILHFPDCVM